MIVIAQNISDKAKTIVANRQADVGSIPEWMVPREKTFRPEPIGQVLDGHPSVPFECLTRRLGPNL